MRRPCQLPEKTNIHPCRNLRHKSRSLDRRGQIETAAGSSQRGGDGSSRYQWKSSDTAGQSTQTPKCHLSDCEHHHRISGRMVSKNDRTASRCDEWLAHSFQIRPDSSFDIRPLIVVPCGYRALARGSVPSKISLRLPSPLPSSTGTMLWESIGGKFAAAARWSNGSTPASSQKVASGHSTFRVSPPRTMKLRNGDAWMGNMFLIIKPLKSFVQRDDRSSDCMSASSLLLNCFPWYFRRLVNAWLYMLRVCVVFS